MRKAKYQLYTTTCKRCGKTITTSTRSLYGADSAHAQYAGICSACMGEKERDEMQASINNAVFRSMSVSR